jgi:hypothetical protein
MLIIWQSYLNPTKCHCNRSANGKNTEISVGIQIAIGKHYLSLQLEGFSAVLCEDNGLDELCDFMLLTLDYQVRLSVSTKII